MALGFGRVPLVHAHIDLQGKKNFFVRTINCQAGELKAGDKVRLAIFDVDPVPQDMGRETVEIPRVFYALEPVK